MMLKHRHLAALVALALLTGCGGGGGSENTAPVPAGRYVGSWTSAASSDETGDADITIHADRTISGTLSADYGPHYGAGGQAVGEIEARGKANINGLWYEAGNPVPWGLSYAGTLRYDTATGTLKGTLLRYRGDGYSRHFWTLTRQ